MKNLRFYLLTYLLLASLHVFSTNYEKGTIYFKLKPEHKNASLTKGTPLYILLNSESIASVQRKFPRHSSPEKPFSETGEPLVDLSLIYEIKLHAQASEDKIITDLLRQEAVEYAEQKRIHEPLYVPNDPAAQQGVGAQSAVLALVKAYQAWGVQKGDTNVMVGVLDTGTEWAIPDLGQNIKLNFNDPINGIDDDNNGYIDDYRGYDLGDQDSDPTPNSNPHGTSVSGISSAKGENGIGIVGAGLRCKLLPVKVFGNIFSGYDGIVYAADRGCKVINLSWGSAGSPSLFEQEIVNYAALNKNVLIVAAGGNTPAELDFYPASYQNVVSVVHTELNDARNDFATFSYNIDMVAPGSNIYGVTAGGVFTNIGGGSSFASPMVAGAAAIVRSAHPSLNATQVAEVLRINTDNIDNVPANVNYVGRMGTGRLNMEKAVNRTNNISVRVSSPTVYTKRGNIIAAGDTVFLRTTFTNYLAAVTGLNVKVTCLSPNVTVLQNSFFINALTTLSSVNNASSPFMLRTTGALAANQEIVLKFTLQTGNYTDYHYLKVTLNTDHAHLTINKINTTVGSNGRLGFVDSQLKQGYGLQMGNNGFLYETGLMIGVAANRVSNCVRTGTIRDNHFKKKSNLVYNIYDSNQQRVISTFNDSLALLPIGLNIKQTAYAYKQAPYDKSFVVEYEIQNNSGNSLDSLLVGLFSDFDVLISSRNRCQWNPLLQMGYTYSTQPNSPHVGVQLLSPDEVSFFAIDNTTSVANNNIYMIDGFNTAEKFLTMSRGMIRTQAGFATAQGNDVLQVISVKIRNLAAGAKHKVAFAILAGTSYNDLQSGAVQVRSYFRQLNRSPLPQVANITRCNPYNTTVFPTNGSKFKFYADATLSNVVHEGRFYTVPFVNDSTTIYVTNADSLYESFAVPVKIKINLPKPKILAQPTILNLAFHSTATFTDQSSSSTARQWDFGAGFSETESQVQRTFSQTGTYPIRLAVSNGTGCRDTLTQNYLVINDVTSVNAQFSAHDIKIYPVPASQQVQLQVPAELGQSSAWITNIKGQKIWEGTIKNERTAIATAHWATGVYCLHVQTPQATYVKKLIIQH